MKIIRRTAPAIAVAFFGALAALAALAAVAAERSEITIFQAAASPNNTSTEASSLVGENAVSIASTKLAGENGAKRPVLTESKVAAVEELDADVAPVSVPLVGVESLEQLQLPAAAKGDRSVARSTAPRRGTRPTQTFGKNQLSLDPSAEKQLLKINLALDDAKQSVQAAKNPMLSGGSSHKKTLATHSQIALKSLNPSQVRVKRHKDGYVRRVSGQFKLESSSKSVTKQVDAFLLANYEELGLDPNFTYSLKESCNSSRCLIKAVKYFDGKEVFGDDLSLITVGDQIRTISGRMALWSSPAKAKMPASRADLEEIAKTHLGVVGQKLLADLDPVEGYRYAAGTYHSVIKLTVVTSMSDAWTVFIRTDNNQVIDKLPLSYDQSSVSSSGVDLLGETQAFFSQPLSNGAYRLIDDSFPATTGSQTTIGNMQNSEDFNAAVYVDAASSSGPWDAAAVSALVNSRKSYDYFKNTFGRNGIDGDDGEMLAFIHYKSNLVNAVYLDIGGGMMAYGDGDGVLSNSLARSLDVAGHELAHGVVARTAGLEYRFQSGALNESFADFFGTQIDGDDWLLGEDTWLQGPDCGGGQKCLRNMANPALSYSAQPTHMDEFQNLSIDVDKGGVHINSGIPNRALYLLAEGLSNAVGRSVAEQIAYQTLLALTPTSDFQDAAETMYEVTSAGDFSAEAAVAVADAWAGVGIEVEVQSPPPEVTPVETSSAQRSVVAYLSPDEGSTAYIPWLQSFDENAPAYDSTRDGVALPSYADLSSPNPSGSFSRLSVVPENEDTDAGSYKGYWYAFVGDVDASGSHVYLNYFFNTTDDSGNLLWVKASQPPPPIVYTDFTVQNIALSPNYANDRTFVLTIQNSPYIYVVTPNEVTSYAVSGPDYTSDGSGAAFVENIDSLRWDPSSRKVVFDYLSCVANPDGTCPSFWSVGVLDTVGGEVSYPFASQPPYIDLGYPAYSNTSDRYITMDLHRYDRDTGAYDSQSVIVFDTYEGGLYDSGAIPNGCGKDSAIWGSPSFTSDDAWFIHQKCTGTPESYSNANYLTSRNEAGDLIETALNDYSSILPVAAPGDEYHVDAYLEFRSRDSIDEAGGANYSLTTPLAHGSTGVTLSGEFCWKNTTSVSSSILEAYTDDGIVSAFLPTTLKPGKAVCSTISIVPPKTLFENESGYIYVPKSIRSNAALSGSVRYSLEASLPEAPELSLYEAGADYLSITVDNISSGGDKTAVLYFDCGTFGTTLDFSESGALAQSKGVWSAHYDSGVTLRQEQLTPGTTFTCEAKAGNRLGYGPTTSLTVSTLSIDGDGDGVPDDEDAFPNDASETTDTDGDGVGDNADAFPNDANETTDTDGDGTGNNADTDDDGDGVADGSDAFPLDASESVDTDGDGIGNNADTDDDGDGVADGDDAFPLDSSESVDTDGDGTGNNADTDDDGDGVADGSDAFPLDASESVDTDGDGIGNNADTDDDGDGVADTEDAFPLDASESVDTDGDGVGDNADAFPNDPTETLDSDGDGIGDNSDPTPNGDITDSDGDGVADEEDAFPNDPNEALDTDGDGIGNNADRDDDGDGYLDLAGALFEAGYYDFCVNTSAGLKCFGTGLGSSQLDQIPSISNLQLLSVGENRACLVDDDGLRCWGTQAGEASDWAAMPANPLQISSWLNHTCVRSSTEVGCFGSGSYAPDLTNPSWVSAGYYFSCGIDDNGLSCWNSQGGSNLESSPSLVNPTLVDAGEGVACATDGSALKCWNRGSTDISFTRAVSNPQVLEVGYGTACVLDDSGVTCDFVGGPGVDLTEVPNLIAPTDVVVARNYACAVDQGDIVCWGAAPSVELGDGVSVVAGVADAFPLDGSEWIDSDGDGVGDNADTDDDGDGVADVDDAFPLDSTESVDTDGDGVGNNADTDDDGDGVADSSDAFPLDASESVDTDGDGVGDNSDVFPDDPNETQDSDTDGVGDNADAFPNDPTETLDTDNDGVGNNVDTDDDGDGYPDRPNGLFEAGYYDFCVNTTAGLKCFGTGLGSSQLDQIPSTSNLQLLSVGENRACLVDDDGLRCWGAQAGEASDWAAMPANPLQISSWLNHTCVRSSTEVGCFGSGSYAPDLTNPLWVSAGYYFSCGIDDNGLSCWNSQGGSNLESSPSLANPSLVDSGEGFACAIDSSDLKCWARDSSEVLFNRTVSNPLILEVGYGTACVLDDAGVSCDFLGGGTDLTNVPNLVAPTDVVVARDYACAVDQGEIVCWGAAPDVDLGQGVSALEGRADVFPLDPSEWIDNDGDGIGDNADADDDGDGVADTDDAFPLDSTESADTDGDGVGNNADTDDDGDGVADSSDAFPLDASESVDTDGDGVGNNADTDDDGDGVADSSDTFPLDASESVDTDGDGVGNNADDDDDGDGVADSSDAFPLDASESVDTDGDGVGNNTDADDDGDGVADSSDAFPLDASDSVDTDGDGVGNNSDIDDDGDGVADSSDAFPLDASESVDTDGDGVGNNADADDDGDGVADSSDAFPLDASESVDTDGDGVGNNADTDDDGDGVADSSDAFPLDVSESVDTDGDGVGNNADTDDDGDGVADSSDAFPLDASESVDTDGDGIGNNADTDDDGDGILDGDDPAPLDPTVSVDTDGDGISDNVDTDDDGDGVPDTEDAFPLDETESIDTDGDGIGNNADTDDDGDGVADTNDAFPLNGGETVDTDSDGVGDNADTDDDGDGYPDQTSGYFSGGYYDFCVDTTAGLRCFGTGLSGSQIDTVPQPDNLQLLSVGENRACMVDGGEFTCWGARGGDATDWAAMPSNALQLSSWLNHTCVRSSTEIGCFGSSTYVPELSSPSWVSAGYYFSCAIDNRGLVCWNSSGGDSLEVSPELVAPTMVDAGERAACAIDDSQVKCWNRGSADLSFAKAVSNPTVLEVGYGTACSLDDNGLGCDYLGFGVDLSNTPSLVAPTNVLVARNYACALDQGEVVCWGNHPNVDLGEGVSVLTQVGDAFPLNASEWVDTDGDGVGNNTDADDDGDGVPDSEDDLPLDATESSDRDGDGIGDNADAFPDDATESVDTDGDGVGDNADAFPADAAESEDFDGDGIGNNKDTDDDGDGLSDDQDAFPLDDSETLDSDGDGVGNNADEDDDNDGTPDASDDFPLDSSESTDTDGDGIGNNADADDDGDGIPDDADAFPLDPSETTDTDGDGIGNNADADDDGDGVVDGLDAFPLNASESADSDGDGVGDNADALPNDPNETADTDQDGVGDNADAFPTDSTESADTDGDGVGDNADAFPNDASETVDTDGDGIGDNSDPTPYGDGADQDGDGIPDGLDAFPLDPSETTDTDGDGIGNNADADDDGDGLADQFDDLPLDPSETTDTDGDGVGNNADADDDGDGVSDDVDVFPLNSQESVDTDGDGIGNNADLDDDGDGTPDALDAFPLNASESVDTDNDGVGNNSDSDDDGDGVVDALDAFPLDQAETIDTDGDGTGNNADSDDDGDGVVDAEDAFPLNASESLDTDGDGVGNNADSDDDGDGVSDSVDAFPLDANETIDTDGDGIGNNSDADDDGDGVADSEDAFPLADDESVDTDGDGVGNNTDTDDDGDGVPDSADAFPLDASETLDTDSDGVGNNADTDDDNDGTPDQQDAFPLDAAEAADTDGDGVGDNADTDDDGDGYPDVAVATVALLNGGERTFCGTDESGYWCEAADAENAQLGISAPNIYGTELAVLSDRACVVSGNGLTCWGSSDGVAAPSLSSPSQLTGYSEHFCALDGNDAYCWGRGVTQSFIEGVDFIAAGNAFTCAIRSGSNTAECWDMAGDPLTGHYTDSPSAIFAGDDLVCVRGSFTDSEFINCWKPSGMESPRRFTRSGIIAVSVGSEACVAHDGGVSCLDQSSSDFRESNYPDIAASKLAGSNGFSCAEVAGNLTCWGDGGDLQSAVNGRALAAPAAVVDAFPDDPDEWLDTDADGIGNNQDTDDDGDGVLDADDALPLDGQETLDTDSDGIGNNADVDDDGDGVNDNEDAFPLDPSETLDTDGDGIGDNADSTPNGEDSDRDGDGVPDLEDAFPDNPGETLDTDEDGVGNNADSDDDGDGVDDGADAFPLDSAEWLDTDGDGVGNFADPDNPSGFCQTDYCVVNDAVSWSFYRVAPEARDVPFEFVLPEGRYEPLTGGTTGAISMKPADAEEYTLFGASGYQSGQYRTSPKSLLLSSSGAISLKAVADQDGGIVGILNAFFIETSSDSGEYFTVFVTGEQTCPVEGCPDVSDIDPAYSTVVLARPSQGEQCLYVSTSPIDSDFDDSRRTLIKLAPNLSIRSEGNEESDLFFGGSDNSFRLCADTPAGTYDYEMTALDGIGGKSSFPLSVHIPASSVGGGAAYWGGTVTDYDADGFENEADDLPFDASESIDTDGDGIGNNTDTDDDGDGVLDDNDAFPLDDSETVDTDNDGVGNNQDSDDDNDGALDSDDAFPLDPTETLDSDGDGVGDNSDPTPNGEDADTDGDGVPDTDDAFPNDASETLDTDGDGIGNNADTDDDGDGYPDARSIAESLIDAGATSVCGTTADGYWCEVGDPNDAYLETEAPDTYGTELAVGVDRACLLTDNGLSCWGSGAGTEPSLSEASSLSGYARHFCALDSGDAHCWGRNVSQTFISDVALVAAGDGFTCAVATGSGSAQCWSISGAPLTGHFTDNPTALYAGKDLVCAKGSFQENEFLNCWKPSGMDSPRRLSGTGINAASVGSEACIGHENGVSCLVNEPGTTNFNTVAYPELAASRLVAGDGFTCAEVSGVLECWGDGSDLETRLEGRTVAAPAVAYDAFPLDASEWLDSDGDGVGDNADNDDDNDSVPDDEDAFPLDESESLDTDSDGVGNNTDSDDDGDGVADGEDAFPLDSGETLDTDGDGFGNNTDTDDDGDGFSDQDELAEGSDPLNPNSVPEESGGMPIWMLYQAIESQRSGN